MDLSVIVPCHNSEHCIQPMLESLLSQVFTFDVELIFVCDHCVDNTHQYIDEYWRSVQHNFRRVVVIDCDVQRCGLARNVGLDHSTGKYIWFVDSDDWLLDGWAITKVITTLNIATTVGICRVSYGSAKFERDCPIMVWQYVFRRTAIGNIRFSGIQPSEDFEFMQKFENVPQIKLPGADIYYYNYLRPNSNMWRYRRNALPTDTSVSVSR